MLMIPFIYRGSTEFLPDFVTAGFPAAKNYKNQSNRNEWNSSIAGLTFQHNILFSKMIK